MNVTSGGRKRIAALASSALVAGALTMLPGVVGLSAAHAEATAIAYTCDVQLTGGQSAFGGEKPVTVTIDTNAPTSATVGDMFSPTVTGSLTFGDAFASQFGPSPVNRISVDLDADTTTGTTNDTIDLVSAVWQRGGGIGSPVPTMELALSGTWDAISPTAPGDLALAIGDLVGTISMGTTFSPNMSSYVLDCAPDAGAYTVDTVAVAAPDTSNYTCDVKLTGGQAAYGGEKRVTVALSTDAPATMETGGTVSPTVTGSLTFGDAFASQFGPSPVNRISVDLDADTTTGTTNDTIDLVSAVWQRGGGIGSPVPTMALALSGTWDAISPTSPGDLALAIGDLVGTISMGTTFSPNMSSYVLDCAADAPVGLDTIAVTQAAEPSPYVDSCYIDMSDAVYPFEGTYPAKVDLSLSAPATGTVGVASPATVGARIEFGPELGAFLVNTPIKKMDLSAAAKGKAGATNASVPVTFGSWNRVYTGTGIGSPINDPIVMNGTGAWAITPTAVGTLPLVIDAVAGGMTFTVTFGDVTTSGTVACTLGQSGSAAASASMVVSETPDVALTGAKVTGTKKVGQKLTASATATPATAAKSYQWLRNGAAISGAKAATYTAAPADLGKSLSVRITATKTGYDPRTVTVAAGKVAAGTQAVSGKAKITGKAKVGKKLTAVPGKAAGAKVKYQWLSNGKVIKKATAKSLKLTKALKGKKVSVKVTYTRAGYTTVTQVAKALKVK